MHKETIYLLLFDVFFFYQNIKMFIGLISFFVDYDYLWKAEVFFLTMLALLGLFQSNLNDAWSMRKNILVMGDVF